MLLGDRRTLLFLLGFVCPSTAISLETLTVLPITLRSTNISFADWITILTLCFAPLLVHIIAGTPEVVCIAVPRAHLSWHRRLCQYNPTTILWRYFAIADRRIRAKSWDANDLAASNALFWTSHGWDGSEEMIETSRQYCIKLPTSLRASVFSTTTAKTIVITLQGSQAIYQLVGGLLGYVDWAAGLSIESIFFPLTILGLLRLCAAPWLTDEYVYTEHGDSESITPIARTTTPTGYGESLEIERKSLHPQTRDIELDRVQSRKSMPTKAFPQAGTTSYVTLLNPASSNLGSRFYPVRSWRGYLFRFFFLLPILALILLCVFYLVPWTTNSGAVDWVAWVPATSLLVNVLYLVWTSATFITYVYYFIHDRTGTTVIPCIVDTWYQIYTVILLVMTISLFVIAAIETRKTPCGTYTSWPSQYQVCGGTYLNSSSTDQPFGLAMRYTLPRNVSLLSEGPLNMTLLPERHFVIADWNGWCIGTDGNSQLVEAKNST